jgi:hypothetical protein
MTRNEGIIYIRYRAGKLSYQIGALPLDDEKPTQKKVYRDLNNHDRCSRMSTEKMKYLLEFDLIFAEDL